MWIQSYQELRLHPKVHRLMRILGISLPEAIGHLHLLWWWALDYAPTGDLTGYSAEDIARAAHWEGDPEAFLEALIACGPEGRAGFVERDEQGLRLHDWADYDNERTLREKTAARKRRQRERQRQALATQAQAPALDGKSDGVSRDSHATVAGQSRDSRVTVTGQSRDSHVTVTGTSRDMASAPSSPPAPSLGIPPQASPTPQCARGDSCAIPDPPLAASVATRSPRTRARAREEKDVALAVLHESAKQEWLRNAPFPDTPAGRCARAYFARNPVSEYRNNRERNAWLFKVLAAFDEAVKQGASEQALLDEIAASAAGEMPWDIARRVLALAREPPRLGFRPFLSSLSSASERSRDGT